MSRMSLNIKTLPVIQEEINVFYETSSPAVGSTQPSTESLPWFFPEGKAVGT